MVIRTTILIPLAFLSIISFAQPSLSSVDSASAMLIRNIKTTQTEEAFIVTDKSLYRSGESIWFRVFLLRAVSQKMSGISRNIFMELIDGNDSVLATLLLDANKAQLGARLNTGNVVNTGFYWIRAYTKYMANEEKSKIAVQPVYIINPALPSETRSRIADKNRTIPPGMSLQFFPEGGSLITGANSTVALRITDNNNDPIAISGYLKDNRDSIVTSISSNQFGLGKFEFFPTRNRIYKAYLNWEGKQMTFSLPPFNFFAGQLAVTRLTNGDRKVTVLLEDSIYRKDLKTYIIGIAKDSLCFASIGTGMYEVIIPEKKFPAGTTTLYLLDEKYNILSERNVYTKNGITLKAELDKTIYKNRDKAELNISVTDVQNRPIVASLCISITDSNFNQPSSINEIVSGYFEKVKHFSSGDWYLAGENELNDELLDLLMMTTPGRRDTIILNQYKPSFFTYDNDSLLYIKGKAFYKEEKPAVKKIATLLSHSHSSAYAVDTTTNEGHFIFPLTAYPDTSQFAIQVMNERGNAEEVSVSVDKLIFPKINGPISKKRFVIKTSTINSYQRIYTDITIPGRGNELSGVTVRGYKKREVNYNETKRVSQDSKIITHDDFGKGGANRITNAILRVPGVQVIGGFVTIKGLSAMGTGSSTEPIVLLDGVQVYMQGGADGLGISSPVLSYLNSLNADEISFIEVLTGPEASTLGVRGMNGAILLNTGASEPELKSNNFLNAFRVRGYHTPLPFIMPNYDIQKNKTAKFNDQRSTLYWQASNATDQAGKARITFFTSDISSTYKIIIRGVTVSGDIIYKTISFQTQ